MTWHVAHCFVGQKGEDLFIANSDLTFRSWLCRAEGGKI